MLLLFCRLSVCLVAFVLSGAWRFSLVSAVVVALLLSQYVFSGSVSFIVCIEYKTMPHGCAALVCHPRNNLGFSNSDRVILPCASVGVVYDKVSRHRMVA